MSETVSIILMIFFYLIPIVVLFFSRWMDKEFKAIGLRVKAIDLLTPYIVFAIHVFSIFAFGFSLFPYMILLYSIIGISLGSFYVFKKKELYYRKFFRIWWRYVFLISLILHIIIGGIAIYQTIV